MGRSRGITFACDGTTQFGTCGQNGEASGLVPAGLHERNVPIWTFPSVHEITTNGTERILVRYGDGRVVMLAYSS